MVEPDHPCIALSCACTITFGIGVVLTVLMMPFTPDASLRAAYLILSLMGAWFAVIAGIWHNGRRTSAIWILITVVSGWFLLSAGIYGFAPIGQATLGGIILTVVLFIVSRSLCVLKPDSYLPVPYYSRAEWPTQDEYYEYHQVESVPSKPRTYRIRPTESRPRYWGSWKGQVIQAIAEARAPLAMGEIISNTNLHTSAVNTAIQELLRVGALKFDNQTYTVEPGLYHEYRTYLEKTWERTTDYAASTQTIDTSSEHKHRTNNGEMVRSKSEVIVANTLARLGIYYEYEKSLANPDDDNDIILPDFTIQHGGKTFYWEHLGMLQNRQYKANWERKLNWYHKCGFDVITSRDGEDGSIDAQTIESIARNRILQEY